MPEVLDSNLRTVIQVDVLLVVWLLAVGTYTSVLRVRQKVYATPEDYQMNQVLLPASPPNDSVERSRRMHQNHLENVLPFLALAVLYAWTRPSHTTLAWLMWGFLTARVLYSVFYMRALQPYRSIAFGVGELATFTMAVLTLWAAFA